jgi:hypothetical protein
MLMVVVVQERVCVQPFDFELVDAKNATEHRMIGIGKGGNPSPPSAPMYG